MLRFTLFGFPVEIHWFFWLNAALLGGALQATGPEAFQALLVWIAVVLVSILVHELGHAFAMRQLGDRRVGIVLFALGGYAQGSLPRTRGQDIWVSFAGPLAQVGAALFVYLCLRAYPQLRLGLFGEGLNQFVFASVFWAILNLVPVLPLDGGRIAAAVAGPRGRKVALGLGVVSALVLAAVLWFVLGAIIGTILFCVLAYNNFKQLRGESPMPFFSAGR